MTNINFVYWPRRSWKTEHIVKEGSENWGLIITRSKKALIHDKAHNIWVELFDHNVANLSWKILYIDDIDWLTINLVCSDYENIKFTVNWCPIERYKNFCDNSY